MNEGLLHVLLVSFIVYQVWTSFSFTAAVKRRRRLKEIHHQVRHHYRLNKDIYPQAINDELQSLLVEVDTLKADTSLKLDGIEERLVELKKKLPVQKFSGIAEKVEVIVIAFALAFAFRAIVLQPFKIPTNSMRPTLHGVNIYSEPEAKADNFKEGWLYPIYYGRSYYDTKTPKGSFDFTGKWQMISVQQPDPRPALFRKLFSKTYYSVDDGGLTFQFPGLPKELAKAVEVNSKTEKDMDKIEGYVETGDHLFVNRYSYNFREPRRGDVAVFQTNGISYAGSPLNGQFYIKRLAGLPGDTLRVTKEGDLFLRKKGEESFVDMSEIHQGFADVMSKVDGYNGYVSLKANDRAALIFKDYVTGEKNLEDGSKLVTTELGDYTIERKKGFQVLVEANFNSGYRVAFTDDYDEFTLGDRQYFMLGDNSQNSLDSRFWGPVPRENLLGTAHSVFWPFSKRWGWVNK